MIGLSSPLSANEIWSTLKGTTVNCIFPRKHKHAPILGDAKSHGADEKATKAIDEHYTEGKVTFTEVSQLPYLILFDSLCFDKTQNCRVITLFHDSILPSFSVGQSYVHVDIEVIPPKQWKSKDVCVYTMNTYGGSTVTTALICNLSRKCR